MKITNLLCLIVLVTATAFTTLAETPKPISASFISSHTSVSPGESFEIAAAFKIKPGWHVYWKNPGDAGLATQVKLSLPENASLVKTYWPVPIKFSQPGNLVGYGYESELIIANRVEISEQTTKVRETLKLEAQLDWLACKDVCIKDKAKLSLEIKVGESKLSQEHERINKALELAATNYNSCDMSCQKNLPFTIKTNAYKSAGLLYDVRFDWKKKKPELTEWYPNPSANIEVTSVSLRENANDSQLQFKVKNIDESLPHGKLDSIFIYKDGNIRRGVEIEFPVE